MAAIATLVDDFASTTGLFTLDAGGAISGGHLSIVADSNWYMEYSTSSYDWTGSSVVIEVTPVYGSGDYTFVEARPVVGSNQNRVGVFIGSNQIYLQRAVAGVGADSGTWPSYNATSHHWIRLREASGTMYLDVSANGYSWSQRDALSCGGLSLSAAYLVMYAAKDSGSGTAYFDNVNNPPAPPPIVPSSFFAMF